MSDESTNPQVNEEHEEAKSPQLSREPEGGPHLRQRHFLAERLVRLRPKGTQDKEPEVGAAEPPLEPEVGAAAPPAGDDSPLPPNYRRNLMKEYRRRRRAQLQMPSAAPPVEADEGESGSRLAAPAGPAPAPPAQPPANNWIPIGPSVVRQGQTGTKAAVSGRVPAIAVAPNGTTVYVGTANGGVWRSDDTGQTWRSLMDGFDRDPTTSSAVSRAWGGGIDSLAVGAIAIDKNNPSRVYVGSGEGDSSAYFGVGPIVTDNGHANSPTWNVETAVPSLEGHAFYALAVDPSNPERVVAGTTNGLYRREPDPNNQGDYHWVRKNDIAPTNTPWRERYVSSVVVSKSNNQTTFYAATWSGTVYSSHDGDQWQVVGKSFPANVGRISLAVQPDNPNVVYALVQNGDVYRLDTTPTDNTWRKISGTPADLISHNQGWYDLAIAVAPDNDKRIYIGGVKLYRCEVTVNGANVNMVPTYIGNSVHADIHTLVFPPGDANHLWVGCDGGVFYSKDPTGTRTNTNELFTARNTGLQTLTINHLAQHPTEDAVLFAGTQDNGGQRFTGEEAWLFVRYGDAGFPVVNWHDPYQILITYVYGKILRSSDGGARDSFENDRVHVPIYDAQDNRTEEVEFYAPLVGTPYNPNSPTAAADANLVAFGSIRPWISTTFGGNWRSIPSNTSADNLNGNIKSLVFASPTKLYAGTMSGGVYRFDKQQNGNWNRTRIDIMGDANNLPPDAPVTDIAVDPSDASRNSIYITLGGLDEQEYRRVWHFNGQRWEARSGPADDARQNERLLPVHATAIVVDPNNHTHLYVGTDIGVWRSTDSGTRWETFSNGLPDAGVTDLLLHNPSRLLRAATFGRGVYEFALDRNNVQGYELYVRDTQLDQGRVDTEEDKDDPTRQGEQVRYWDAPDIKLDTLEAGNFQLPKQIDFYQFVDKLDDRSQGVARGQDARVYVQVHNRGITTADNVQVMLLLAKASAGTGEPPLLPNNYWTKVQNGTLINDPNWKPIGQKVMLNGVRVGFPKVACFDLSSNMLDSNGDWYVLALIHHANDSYTEDERDVKENCKQNRKASVKKITVVIPQTNWKLLHVSSQEPGQENLATNAFDGKPDTMWVTRWTNPGNNDHYPHQLDIDLGAEFAISGFTYLPRQDGNENGRIKVFEFYVSPDGQNWGAAVVNGTWANDASEKRETFPSKQGRYVRLEALSEVNGNIYASAAEINVF